MGAGVLCSVASLDARERLEPGVLDGGERARKSVARKYPEEAERGPWA